MNKEQQYYWIISMDSLAASDWDTITRLPHFQAYLEEAAWCRHVYSVYPSVTYPAHTSIVTGRWPVHHGVTNNTLFQPERLGREDWNWHSRRIHGKTLFDVAYENNLSTATYLWPVTAGNRRITYNMPEIFANRKWQKQAFVSLMNGSKWMQVEALMKFGDLMDGIRQPALDQFLHQVVLHMARTRRPNVQFIHYVDLDSTRHLYGHDSEEAGQALARLDVKLGDLMDFVREEGLEDRTTFVVLGDHSSIDEHTAVCTNVIFRDLGLLTVHDSGRVTDWQAISHTCDGSAYIHVKDPARVSEIAGILAEFSRAHDNCIEKIYTGAQAKGFGACADCDLMIEARRGYFFLDEADGAEELHAVQPGEELQNSHITWSTHGYSPYKRNYQTFFSMRGPRITTGEVEGPMRLIDEGPTLAYLLGGSLPEADGRLMMEFYR